MCAIASARLACAATVEDQEVREQTPLWLREKCHEIAFDRHWGGGIGERKSVRQSIHMRVHDDAHVTVETIAQHDVGGLARDAAQEQQLVHGARNFTAKLFDQQTTTGVDRFGLVAKEPDRAHIGFDLERRRARKRVRCWKRREECRGRAIDRHVGALRGENRGDQEFVRRTPVEFAVRIGIARLEVGENVARAQTLRGSLARQRINHGAFPRL